jgi:hypothetical protein
VRGSDFSQDLADSFDAFVAYRVERLGDGELSSGVFDLHCSTSSEEGGNPLREIPILHQKPYAG